jgi:hypothetical protein
MTKVYLSVIGVLVSALLLGGWVLSTRIDELAVLKVQNTGLAAQNESLTEASERAAERAKSDRKVLVARQASIAAQARKLAQENQGLQNALRSNNTWSDTDVPPDVQSALGGPPDGPAGVLQPD